MKRLTPEQFWAVFSKDCKTRMVVNPVCEITFDVDDFYAFLAAYAEHLEETAWVCTMEKLPPQDKILSDFSIDCLVTDGGIIKEDYFDYETQKFHRGKKWYEWWMPKPKLPTTPKQ